MKGTKVALGILLVKISCGYTVCLMHTYTYYMHKVILFMAWATLPAILLALLLRTHMVL